jgi:hypothetical protein
VAKTFDVSDPRQREDYLRESMAQMALYGGVHLEYGCGRNITGAPLSLPGGDAVTATVFYDSINEIALISNTFTNAADLPADPTTVACIITDPAGVSTVHTYNGALPADISKVSQGKYSLAVPCSPSAAGVDGLWGFEWVGTGAVSDVQPGTWRVLPANLSQLCYIGLEEMKDRLSIKTDADDYAIQTAMLAVDQDGDGIYEQGWTQGTDYVLKLGRGQFNVNASGIARPYRKIQVCGSGKLFPFTWPLAHLDRVQIATTWGWTSVPWQVAEANRILASDEYRMKDAPFGVAGVSDIGLVRIQSNPWLVENLRPFVNARRKVGV